MPAGVKAVMGHEMGHYVLGHLPRLVLYNSALAAVAMFRDNEPEAPWREPCRVREGQPKS